MECCHISRQGSFSALGLIFSMSSITGVAIESSRIWRKPRYSTASSILLTFALRPKYTLFTIRSKREVSEGSRRMISAICEV